MKLKTDILLSAAIFADGAIVLSLPTGFEMGGKTSPLKAGYW
jgi:hypothetical protein